MAFGKIPETAQAPLRDDTATRNKPNSTQLTRDLHATNARN